MKTLYILAWFLLIIAVLITTLMEIINPFAIVLFGLIAAGLLSVMYFWSDYLEDEEQTIG